MWYWNGKEYAYNSGEAQTYLQYLQQSSLIANQRNQNWEKLKQSQKQIEELNTKFNQQKTEIAQTQSQLAALGNATQIQNKITALQSSISAVNEQLKPFITQENQQIQKLQQAVSTANRGISDLQQTIESQSTSLRQLISLGVLASESDIDFFDTQIQPKVNQFTEQLQQRNEELSQQQNSLNQLINNWQQQLNNIKDTTSKQYLTNLIDQSKAQLNNIANLKAENQTVITKLEEQLNQAVAALETLRQKQELEISQKIESNDTRLESLQSQLNSEKAAENIKNNDTVLAYAQLLEQIKTDAWNDAKTWIQQYQDGYVMTKNADESMQKISQSVDDLITYITDNLAAPLGTYNRTQTVLENGINTLGVVVPRVDGYEQSVIDAEQEIEKIKQRILQDAQLWEEIAPLAIRYGLESEQLKEYLAISGDSKTKREVFLAKYPENGSAIDLLQAEILEGSNPNSQISQQLNATRADDLLNANSLEGLNPLQQLFNKAKATQADLQAKGIATLSQADWYEKQAAYNWSVSRKNGLYWWEEVCTRGRSGRRNCHWEQHTDQNWSLWNKYSQIFPQLRKQGQDYLVEADKWRKEKERLEPLVNQWSDANNAANEAESAIKEARDLFAQLEAARASIPQAKTQLEMLESLLPTLKKQLVEAQQEKQTNRTTVAEDWTEYDVNSEEYQQALADILQRRGELNHQAIETQAKLADSERWVENQSVALST